MAFQLKHYEISNANKVRNRHSCIQRHAAMHSRIVNSMHKRRVADRISIFNKRSNRPSI